MTLQPRAAARPVSPAHERTQREHELSRALEAARTLRSRLELLGDHTADIRSVHDLQDRLAAEIGSLGAEYYKLDEAIVVVERPPCQPFTMSHRAASASSSSDEPR